MRVFKRRALAFAALPFLLATAAHNAPARVGSFGISATDVPYFSGSRIALTVTGAPGSTAFTALGGGTVSGNTFDAPYVDVRQTTGILGAAQGALAYARVTVLPPPPRDRALIAVAAYENGIALHDPATFALLGYVGIGGPPGDVAFTAAGDILAPQTDGNDLAWVARSPWRTRFIGGVPLGNEVAWDAGSSSAFVTNRDVAGMGALTRIAADGSAQRVVTGETAEGIALDPTGGTAFVSNVNDASVAHVDTRSLRVLAKVRAPVRAFAVAFDSKRARLFVVANISPDMHSGAGYVASYSSRGEQIARSAGMQFPLGIALDAGGRRAFVTDEAASVVYVLDSTTLKPLRPPLATCSTPWRPRIFHDRLYVPCTRANAVDVIDVRTLRRVRGAPFATGGFPLSVAVWP